MEPAILEKANQWLNSNIDAHSKKEIQQMLNAPDDTELSDAFYKDLEFGTGGLRGVMGIGSNRVNKYTIGKATQGLGNYLKKAFPGQQIKVAIAHDSRNNSKFFAETTAAVFSANDIKVYFFKELRPTPALSFAVRELGCQSGVVITASHNPKEYNGYKAYWDDGAQVVPPHDKNIIDEVNAIKNIEDIKFAINEDLVELIGEEIDQKYLAKVKGLSLSPEVIARQKNMKIVYSPIHGTGITLVPKALKQFGFENISIVEAQSTPDGNFPTVVYPNPEEKEAMSMSLEEARKTNADLIMATDPDADRVGIGAKNLHGEYQLLSGNQAAALLVYYTLLKWKEKGRIDGHQFAIKTIVTTDLIFAIGQGFDIPIYETLTGFKYIASVIRSLEGEKTFIVGGEESYGYLSGDFVRDKDAVSSCAMLAEVAAWAKDQGLTLFDLLIDIYKRFGYYKEGLVAITKKGQSGAGEIQEMMKELRANPPKEIAGSPMEKILDYKSGINKNLKTGKEGKLDFPTSNVLQFITEDGTKVSARPSGTEPKIKFYFEVKGQLKDASEFDGVTARLEKKIGGIIGELKLK